MGLTNAPESAFSLHDGRAVGMALILVAVVIPTIIIMALTRFALLGLVLAVFCIAWFIASSLWVQPVIKLYQSHSE